MYYNHHIRLHSPLMNPNLREIHSRLMAVLGDSKLLINLAVQYTQGYMYRNVTDIHILAQSFADSLSPDLVYCYCLGTSVLQENARAAIYRDIYNFISQTAVFLNSNPSVHSLFRNAAMHNLVYCVDRVRDDDHPIIELSARTR